MTALPGVMPASVVDQYASHHLRCGAKEVSPISPVDLALVDQPQVDLVNERWLERVPPRSRLSWRLAIRRSSL